MKNNHYRWIVFAAFSGLMSIFFDQIAYQSEKKIIEIESSKDEIIFEKEYNLQLNEALMDLSLSSVDIESFLLDYSVDSNTKTKIHSMYKSKLYHFLKDLPKDKFFKNIKPKNFNLLLNKLTYSNDTFAELRNEGNTVFDIIHNYTLEDQSNREVYGIWGKLEDNTYFRYIECVKALPDIIESLNSIRSKRQKVIILSMALNILTLTFLFLFFKKMIENNGSCSIDE